MAVGGVSKPDRALAGVVRRLTLKKIQRILELDEEIMTEKQRTLHNAILIRLSGTILPRLTEVTGEDGEAIVVTIVKYDNTPASLPAKIVPTPLTTGTG